jgi:copper(I)-binding protein
MNLRRLLLATPLMLLCAASAIAHPAHGAPEVQAPWARPTVQGQGAGGGFLRIVGGASSDRLLSASAPVSARDELHTMSMDGNVMRMREVPAIDIPAGQTVELRPGGLHLMFMGLAAPLQAGMRFPVTLRFEKAGEVTVQMEVAAQPPGGKGAAGHGGHGAGHRH